MVQDRIDELNLISNEEWFAEYPYDADLRIKYANELQEMLEEYFLDRIDNKTEIKRDDFSFLFLVWLGFVANDQYNKHELASQLFEHDFGFSLYDRANRIADMLYGSSETSRFNSSVVDGESYDLLSQSYSRAVSVARNETTGLANEMLQQEAINEGYLYKTWVATIDKKTRDSHRDADGQTVPINEPFEVGGSYLMFPNDESMGADASEIINCRCYCEYTNERGESVEVDEEVIENDDKAQVIDGDSYTYDGVTYKVDGHHVKFEPEKREREVAEIYAKHFNLSVTLNPKVLYPEKIRVPDLTTQDGVGIDIKRINGSGKTAVYDRVRKGKGQAKDFIVDYTKSTLTESEVESQILKIFSDGRTDFVNRIVTVKDNSIIDEYIK